MIKYNICILVLNSPNIGEYAQQATIINKLYANKYNYDFIVERCPLKEDLNKDYMWDGANEYMFVWSKAPLIKKHLINYDYLFYIDSDAIFVDHDQIIDSFIDENFTNETCLLFGTDCITKNYCYHNDKLNAGVLIAKNTNKTFKILDDLIQGPNIKLCHELKYNHPREQGCLNLIKNKYNLNEIKIVDYYKLNGIDGSWIKHFMGVAYNKRFEIFNLYLHKFLIEYNIYDNSKLIKNSIIKIEKEKLFCNQKKYCIIVKKDQNNINAIINYIYATKHGYDYIMIDAPIMIDNYIIYYDYLLIIDNNNIININYNIQDFINNGNDNEDIIVINDNNYLIKNNNSKNKITKNITNELWFNKNISFNLLNELLLQFNYVNDIDYDINTINHNINTMIKQICNDINGITEENKNKNENENENEDENYKDEDENYKDEDENYKDFFYKIIYFFLFIFVCSYIIINLYFNKS
jgi:hypothetical protein